MTLVTFSPVSSRLFVCFAANDFKSIRPAINSASLA
jgi:hypothetical protein